MWLFLLFSHCDVWLFVTYGLQHARLRHPPLFPGGCLNSCPLSQWCCLTISSFATLFSFCFNLSQHHSLFCWVSSLHQAARVMELHLQHQSFQWIFRVDFFKDWLVWYPCCPRDFQDFSLPLFASISSSMFSVLYGPNTLTSVRDYYKNHSFD